MNKIILPELGEGIEKAVIAGWHFKEGDQISNDEEDVVEVVINKAAVEGKKPPVYVLADSKKDSKDSKDKKKAKKKG